MLKLYDYPDCPYAQKVRVVLAEKELEYETVLVDDDEIVCDSTIINEYLDDEYPSMKLMPEDSQSRAQVRWFEDYCDNEFIPYTTQLLVQLRKPDAERDAQQVEQIRDRLRRGLFLLRDRLDAGEFIVCKEFTLADAAWAPRMLVLGRLGFEFEPALASVQGWVDRIRSRPSVRALGL